MALPFNCSRSQSSVGCGATHRAQVGSIMPLIHVSLYVDLHGFIFDSSLFPLPLMVHKKPLGKLKSRLAIYLTRHSHRAQIGSITQLIHVSLYVDLLGFIFDSSLFPLPSMVHKKALGNLKSRFVFTSRGARSRLFSSIIGNSSGSAAVIYAHWSPISKNNSQKLPLALSIDISP